MKTYVIVYFGTAIVAMFLVPIISRLAKRYRFVDSPGPRKVHHTPVPRIGGVVFIVSTLAVMLPMFFLNNDIGRAFREERMEFIALLAGASFIFAVGLIDDLRSVRPNLKFLCIVGASLAVCASGATLRSISLGPWFELEFGWLAWPLAIIWITTITIGMNFIDGLDGLAGGIAAIVCGSILVLALWSSQTVIAVLMLALLGSVTGFLFFNFHPAKIFMGDSGSMFLGFMIGAGSLVCQAKTCTLVGLALPFLVMGVPILDAGFTMIRRAVLYRRSIFSSEMGHIHHYLLGLGLPQQTVVVIIYAVTVVGASIGMFMLTVPEGWSIGLLTGGLVFLFGAFACLGAAHIRETIAALKRNRAISRKKREDRNCFEDTQLRMRGAVIFEDWWEVMCEMAERMQFQNMELYLRDNGRPETRYQWKSSDDESSDDLTAEFVLPISESDSKSASEMKVRIHKNNSLEATCRQVAFLGRLMDEFPPPRHKSEKLPIHVDARFEHAGSEQKDGSVIVGADTIEKAKKTPEPINVMGVPVVPFGSYDQALEIIEKAIESGQKSFWIAVNPQKVYRAWHEQELMNIMERADVAICDGVGVSMASKILHGKSIERVTGCDLFFRLLSLASRKKWGVYLLGASPESNAAACARIQKLYPDLQIVGRQDGYFKDSSKVIKQINESKADLLFVGMGSPQQEYWIWNNRQALNVPFCMGVGGSFDVASGKLKRAPKILQKIGTEFLFQLVTEPRKRWPRQKVYFPFIFRVIGKKVFGSVMLTGEQKDIGDGIDMSKPLSVKDIKFLFEQR
jgi:exopolysaccharide biosynthesis WecB/TagA/CpsF family protein